MVNSFLMVYYVIGVYQDKEGSTPRNCSYLYVNGIYERFVFFESDD